MYEECWMKCFCSECKKANWICEGDLQDCTAPDTEAIECWSCGHQWYRGDQDHLNIMYGFESAEEEAEHLANVAEKGRESPR